MLTVRFRLNPTELRRLRTMFRRGVKVSEKVREDTEDFANRIFIEAVLGSASVSSRISGSFEKEFKGSDEVFTASVRSKFKGYPTSKSDSVGDAAEASSRGWATFTHRYDLGYPGTNPAAGFTPAHKFLTGPFDRLKEEWARIVLKRAVQWWGR